MTSEIEHSRSATQPQAPTVPAVLARTVAEVQRNRRIPGLSVALSRADRPLWLCQVGSATVAGNGVGPVPLTATTQFRAGSITKTFTAVLIMQLRDAGLLGLDDRLAEHLAVPAFGEMTIRRLLTHMAGVQREPYGDVWDTLDIPDGPQLIAELDRAEQVLPAGHRWHYSNLGFALLGLLVERLTGGTWFEVLSDRLLGPLGLSRTTLTPEPPTATGYLVDAYADTARPEPWVDTRGAAGAAQLWSTPTDLARWMSFLADPGRVPGGVDVLASRTAAEMRVPVAVRSDTDFALAWGLGLMLWQREGQVIHAGHDGAMPGFLAAAYARCAGSAVCGDRDDDDAAGAAPVAAAVCGSSGTGGDYQDLAHRLIELSLAEDPPQPVLWAPGPPVPDAYAGLLGRWWSEGFEMIFRWRRGRLEALPAGAEPGDQPSVFRPVQADLLRTESGREAGELLRLTRDGNGAVVRMHWATYRVTRDQQTFGRYSVGSRR